VFGQIHVVVVKDRIFDHFFAFVVKAELSTFLCVSSKLVVVLLSEIVFVEFLLHHLIRCDFNMLLIGFSELFSHQLPGCSVLTVEFSDQLLAAVGVYEHSVCCGGSTLGLPVKFS